MFETFKPIPEYEQKLAHQKRQKVILKEALADLEREDHLWIASHKRHTLTAKVLMDAIDRFGDAIAEEADAQYGSRSQWINHSGRVSAINAAIKRETAYLVEARDQHERLAAAVIQQHEARRKELMAQYRESIS